MRRRPDHLPARASRAAGLCALCQALVALFLCPGPATHAATNYILLGWSESGMQFIDEDYSVFAIHPPGNIFHAQIIQLIDGNQARLLTNPAAANLTVTYEAVADPDGSINRTSQGKNNFWEHAPALFGSNLPPDMGFGAAMPGPSNTPQPMVFSSNFNWFTAAGVPVTPYDDAGKFNPYPLFRMVARKGAVAVTNIDMVAGVTDEMNCRLCHASGSSTSTLPAAGWVYEPHPDRDFRLNILRLHDERQATNAAYAPALAAQGYDSAGLFAHVKASGQPILCARCHFSTVIPGSGFGSIKPLTQAIHKHHATVIDPRDGQVLDSETNRATCYTCHGGAVTHFLRGAMGTADTATGELAIQCQSCHGTMTQVAATNRVGWLSLPNCQACHIGDALENIGGQIRFTNALTNGVLRTPANDRFATNPNTPTNGYSLFHFSRGHGNLVCSACHGPPHAEFPSSVRNDNIRSLQVQGRLGVMAECTVCHGAQILAALDGPHGMHRHDFDWADGGPPGSHSDFESEANCTPCHGPTSGDPQTRRGTILSQARGNRSFLGLSVGDITAWQGQTFGCTHCHNSTAAPTAGNTATNTRSSMPVTFTLTSSTNNVRIVMQPLHGLVGLSNKVATYTPEPGFLGTDIFTFASAKPQKESALATGTVIVTEFYSVPDGVPDWWRKFYFGGDGSTTNTQSCATCDPDNDGSVNRDEFRAGTDPMNNLNVLRLFAIAAKGSNTQVGFQTEVTRRYSLDFSSNLLSGTWKPVASNVWGHHTTLQLTATNGAAEAFSTYRVRVQ